MGYDFGVSQLECRVGIQLANVARRLLFLAPIRPLITARPVTQGIDRTRRRRQIEIEEKSEKLWSLPLLLFPILSNYERIEAGFTSYTFINRKKKYF